jgi:hypothetical protein
MKQLVIALALLLAACTSQGQIDSAIATGIAGTQAAQPTEHVSSLETPKGDGVYRVGRDIGPGEWQSGIDDNAAVCVWWLEDDNGGRSGGQSGQVGGTAYIPDWAIKFVTTGCGTWTYLGR